MSDFTTVPDYTVLETIRYNTIVSQFENNAEQRRSKVANPVRRWELVFNNRGLTEIGTIKTFFNLKKGKYTSFTWTNPNDSTEYTVRFDDDSFQYEMVAYQIYNYKLTFIEVV